jgi:putative PIN family toxin of toxin-antitoxin system
MRIVLDANVLIASLISKGVCFELLEHCVLNHFVLVSEHILGEVGEHLERKFKFSRQEATEAIELFRERFEIVEPCPIDRPVCRDPDDDIVLATAVAANARCLITGDKDLLVLQRFGEIAIVAPRDFATFEPQAL